MAKRPLPICIDVFVGGEQHNENELLALLEPSVNTDKELALASDKRWEPGQTLRIQFLDGDPALHQRVEAHARKWLADANLDFHFGNFPDAEIRVTVNGIGYWSMIGTDAVHRPAPLPTICLGGFTAHTDDLEMQRVVLHEFGHAIACVHEHASPTFNIPWDQEKVYDYYESNYGWTKAEIDHNVLKRYSAKDVDHTATNDPKSIMQYPVHKEHTIGGYEIGWNHTLSKQDKAFIAKMYP